MPCSSSPWHSRGYLPHFDSSGFVQLVSFRLADSLPRHVMRAVEGEQDDVTRFWRKEKETDAGHGACYLRRSDVAETVERSLLFDDDALYRLLAWVVMPNHVHVLLEMKDTKSLSTIVQRWKGSTAHKANRLLCRTGRFWYPDYHDRYIRNEEHFRKARNYVEQNPARAKLCLTARQWPWSSARRRLPALAGRGRPPTQ